jgi:hypothetical protein
VTATGIRLGRRSQVAELATRRVARVIETSQTGSLAIKLRHGMIDEQGIGIADARRHHGLH